MLKQATAVLLSITLMIGGNKMAWIGGNYYLTEPEIKNNCYIVAGILLANGWNLDSVEAALGNIWKESTVNPNIWEGLAPPPADPYTTPLGYGLCGWTPAKSLILFCDDRGLNWQDGDAQVEMMRGAYSYNPNTQQYEYGRHWGSSYDPGAPQINPPCSWDDFIANSQTQSRQTLCEWFMYYYEKPSYDPGIQDKQGRIDNTNKIHQWFVDDPPVPSGGSLPIWMMGRENLRLNIIHC